MNKRDVLFLSVLGVALLSLTAVSVAAHEGAEAGTPESGHTMIMPDALTWNDGPPSLPPGIKLAVLEGDMSKPGPFTVRIKLPAGYQIRPHWHPAIEHVTVLDGSFYMGLGETFDEEKATQLPVAGFAVMQIGTRHYAFTRAESIIQLHGIGPWGITYVNAADDPRNAPKKE